jgi:hypothetical protein
VAFTTAWDQAQATDSRYPYRVGVQILADASDAGSWCDLNKPVPATAADLFYNRLLKMPTVEVRSEVRPGRFASSVSSIVVDDWDAAFGKQPPWPMWNITGGAESLVSWYHARLRVRVAHHAGVAGMWTWFTLGTFIIEDIQRDGENKTATIKLIGLEKLLMDAKASVARVGDSWMVNAPIPMIATRLVEAAGAGMMDWETGSPPASCTLDTVESYYSPLGNIPPTVGDPQVWNEHHDFVPRFALISPVDPTIIYYVGHTITTNKAAAARWDMDLNTWSLATYDLAGYCACEGIYAAQDATYNTASLYVFAAGNALAPPGDNTPHNHSVVIFEINSDTLAYVGIKSTVAVWMPQYLATEGSFYGGVRNWGSFDAAVMPYAGQDVPVFFRSQVNVPGYYTDGVDARRSQAVDSGTYMPRNYPCSISDGSGDSLWGFDDWEFDAGYYYLYLSLGVGTPMWPARAPVHTQLSEAFRYDATRHSVYWVRWEENSTHTTGFWYLSRFDTTASPAYNAGQIINLAGADYGHPVDFDHRCITAFDVVATSASAGYIWFGVECRPAAYDEYSDTAARTKLLRFSLPAHNTTIATPTELVFSDATSNLAWSAEWVTANQRWYAPLIVTIRHNPINSAGAFNPVWGVVANRRGALAQAFGIWAFSTAGDISGGKVNRAGWPVSTCPFVQTAFPRTASSISAIEYFQDQATGVLYMIGLSNSSGVFGLWAMRYGDVCDAENTWASCNPIQTADAVYGVSASDTPADMRVPLKTVAHWAGEIAPIGSRAPGGRVTLWQLKSELSDVIPVADFGDDSAWDALGNLRQAAGNYVVGFNASGGMAFRARSTTTPTYTIVKQGDDFAVLNMLTLAAESLTSSLDHSAIINSISITPRIGGRDPVTCDLICTPTPAKTTEWGGRKHYVPASSATDAVISVQYAANSAQRIMLKCVKGGKPKAYSGTAEPSGLLFSWSHPLADLSTILSAQAVQTATDISVYGLYTDGSGACRLGEGRIEIGDVVYVGDGVACKITAIYPDVGQIELEGTVGGTATHKAGTPVRIIPTDRSRMGDSGEGICTLTASYLFGSGDSARPMYVDDSSHIRPGMVLYKEAGYVQVLEVSRDGSLVTRGAVLGGVRGIGSGSGSTVTWAAGTNLRGAVWVEWLGRTYPAGDTGASFSIAAPAKDADNSLTFAVGDRIVITCPGMTLRKMDNAVVRHENALSIERYGKKEYKLGDNHLLDTTRAIAVMADMEDAPTYLTEARGVPLVTVFEIGTTINVLNQHLFPSAAGYTVAHEVIGIRWNLDTCLMDLTMRSIETAGRGETAVPPPAGGLVTGWAKDSLYVRRHEE